jgi:hypothetical protein
MAEVTALRNNALPYPVYGLPWTVVLPILDNDGDPVTGAAGLDSEVSKNADTFADCTNEATEIAGGIYYLSLTAAEMAADIVAGRVQTSTTDAKTTVFTLNPRKLVSLRSATAQAGASTTITLDSGAVAIDDYYNACLIYISSGTGSGQARVISDYVGSTKVATVSPAWATNPDNTSVFSIYLPEGRQVGQVDAVAFGGAAGTFSGGRPETNTTHIAGNAVNTANAQVGVNVVQAAGTAWGSGAITRGSLNADTGLQSLRSNTVQAGASGSVTLDAGASSSTDFYKDAWVVITGGTGVGQARLITSYDGTTKVATVAPNWATAPSGSSTFAVLPVAAVDLALWGGTAPNALASGRVDAKVGAMDNNVMTAAAAAADLSQEIRSEIDANSTQLAAIKAKTDNLPSDPADESSIQATLATIAGYVDTEVAAIKAKTDNLPASPAAAGDAMTLTSAYDFAKGTVAMAEAYAANGAAPSPVQALFAIHQLLMQFGITGTNLTVKKLDNATTAFVATLDNASTPTALART